MIWYLTQKKDFLVISEGELLWNKGKEWIKYFNIENISQIDKTQYDMYLYD